MFYVCYVHVLFIDNASAFQDRYYEAKFGIPPDDPESESFRRKVAAEYTLGLCWVLRYYYQVIKFRSSGMLNLPV